MTPAPFRIATCPPGLASRALVLVLSNLPEPQRRALVEQACPPGLAMTATEGLFVALEGDQLSGAVWAQPQPGNTALFWPPKLAPGGRTAADSGQLADALGRAATAHLDATNVAMTQFLRARHEEVDLARLTGLGFFQLAELLYMSCETIPASLASAEGELAFEPYHDSQRDRLAAVIRATYQGTQDCPLLNDARNVDDVVAGYQSVGDFDPAHWYLVRHEGQDVGVLLLAVHPNMHFWELVYMGLIPAARGHGWGRQLVAQALRQAERTAVRRIVLAVDSTNEPALGMYRQAGFELWDRRTVYVRLASGRPPEAPVRES